jgi:ankyrin repeat protein
LMERGANVDASTGDGQTALHWAARSGHEAVVRLLINNGANLDTKDDGQKTALARADEGGHKGTVQLLIANGALVAGPPIAPKTDPREESSETPSGDFESVIVNFYLKEKEQHRVLTPSVHELVYSPGPKATMSRGQPHDISPDFRWLHLPANNVSRQATPC